MQNTPNDEVKRDYQVVVEVLSTHEFTISDVNSPDEAAAVAEQLMSEGEEGTILTKEIMNLDWYPVKSKEETYN
jgi:hypothetical protein